MICSICEGGKVKITGKICIECEVCRGITEFEAGDYFSLPLTNLTQEERKFIVNFIIHYGHLIELGDVYNKSYYLLKKDLDNLVEKLKNGKKENPTTDSGSVSKGE